MSSFPYKVGKTAIFSEISFKKLKNKTTKHVALLLRELQRDAGSKEAA